MLSQELIGRRVKVNAWYDHEQLIAAHRRPLTLRDGPEGTVTQVNGLTGQVSVRVERLGHVLILPFGDVELLDTDDHPDW